MEFKGSTFDLELDLARLSTQKEKVKAILDTGNWVTLNELQELTGGSHTSLSARLRDFRRPENGGYTIERRRRGEPSRGLHEYRLLKPTAEQVELF